MEHLDPNGDTHFTARSVWDLPANERHTVSRANMRSGPPWVLGTAFNPGGLPGSPTARDADWFSFISIAGGTYYVECDPSMNKGTAPDLEIVAVDSENVTTVLTDNRTGNRHELICTIPTAGTHYLRIVTPTPTNTSSYGYGFRFHQLLDLHIGDLDVQMTRNTDDQSPSQVSFTISNRQAVALSDVPLIAECAFSRSGDGAAVQVPFNLSVGAHGQARVTLPAEVLTAVRMPHLRAYEWVSQTVTVRLIGRDHTRLAPAHLASGQQIALVSQTQNAYWLDDHVDFHDRNSIADFQAGSADSGRIDSLGDSDWWRVSNPNPGERIRVAIDDGPECVVQVFDGTLATITQIEELRPAAYNEAFATPQRDPYYVRITSGGNDSLNDNGKRPYHLTIETAAAADLQLTQLQVTPDLTRVRGGALQTTTMTIANLGSPSLVGQTMTIHLSISADNRIDGRDLTYGPFYRELLSDAAAAYTLSSEELATIAIPMDFENESEALNIIATVAIDDIDERDWSNNQTQQVLPTQVWAGRRVGFVLHQQAGPYADVTITRQTIDGMPDSQQTLNTREDGHSDDNDRDDFGEFDNPRPFAPVPQVLEQLIEFTPPPKGKG